MTDPGELGASQDGTVILDIGGDVGALVLMTAHDLLGAEIEISPLDETAADIFQQQHPHVHTDGTTHTHLHPDRTHVAVRERMGPGGVRFAAIYPGLRQGRYQLWNLDGTQADVVEIVGGQVTQLDWS